MKSSLVMRSFVAFAVAIIALTSCAQCQDNSKQILGDTEANRMSKITQQLTNYQQQDNQQQQQQQQQQHQDINFDQQQVTPGDGEGELMRPINNDMNDIAGYLRQAIRRAVNPASMGLIGAGPGTAQLTDSSLGQTWLDVGGGAGDQGVAFVADQSRGVHKSLRNSQVSMRLPPRFGKRTTYYSIIPRNYYHSSVGGGPTSARRQQTMPRPIGYYPPMQMQYANHYYSNSIDRL